MGHYKLADRITVQNRSHLGFANQFLWRTTYKKAHCHLTKLCSKHFLVQQQPIIDRKLLEYMSCVHQWWWHRSLLHDARFRSRYGIKLICVWDHWAQDNLHIPVMKSCVLWDIDTTYW